MTKTIVLTDLVIRQLEIDYVRERVRCVYALVDAEGNQYETGEAFFWVTMPTEPSTNDFLLPPEYVPLLVSLQTDADAALTAVFLV